MIENRLQALRALMDENKLDAVIVSKYVNLHYFSGYFASIAVHFWVNAAYF